jgi:hypothetical protein
MTLQLKPDILRKEIDLFMDTLAPNTNQKIYVANTLLDIEKELHDTSKREGVTIECAMLVAFCGELSKTSSKQQQAEFASRLFLADILLRSMKQF